MADKVVHFEVVGKDGPKLMQFYGQLFGWTVNADNPMNYGMVDAAESGIGGGISAAQEGSDGHLSASTTFRRRWTRQRASVARRSWRRWRSRTSSPSRCSKIPRGTSSGWWTTAASDSSTGASAAR